MAFGMYHFARKKVAFRNDFCVRCRAPRLAVCERSLDVVSLRGLPILPLGRFRRWYCRECRWPTELVITVRRLAKALPFAFIAAFVTVLWRARVDSPQEAGLWIARIGLALTLVIGVVWMVRGDNEARRRKQLAGLPPCQLTSCPACDTSLRPGFEWTCETCGMVRM